MIIFDPAALHGKSVYLQPLRREDKEELRLLAKDERIWEFTKTLMIDEGFNRQFDDYFELAIRLPETGNQAFVIHRVNDGAVIGMTRAFMIEPKEKRLEFEYMLLLNQSGLHVVEKIQRCQPLSKREFEA